MQNIVVPARLLLRTSCLQIMVFLFNPCVILPYGMDELMPWYHKFWINLNDWVAQGSFEKYTSLCCVVLLIAGLVTISGLGDCF